MSACLPVNKKKKRLLTSARLKHARQCTVAVVGCSSVGKSNFASTLFGHEFDPYSEPTQVELTLRNEMMVDDDPFVVMVIDTPPFGVDFGGTPLSPTVLHKCQGYIVMYDVCSRESFEALPALMNFILKESTEDHTHIVICGNKIDKPWDDQVVKTDEGHAIAEKYSAIFFETSAKSGTNVQESIHELAKALKQAGKAPKTQIDDEIHVIEPDSPQCIIH